jgi:hypothetical protein
MKMRTAKKKTKERVMIEREREGSDFKWMNGWMNEKGKKKSEEIRNVNVNNDDDVIEWMNVFWGFPQISREMKLM